MTRRRFWWSIGGLALLAGLGVGFWSAAQPAGIGRFSCMRIRVGMNPDEVEAVVGCPPGDYGTEARAMCESWLHLPGQIHTDWYSDDGHLRVVFEKHRVVGAYWWPRDETVMDRVLRWVGL